MWMLLTLFYGLVKGAREIFKKKALEKNSVIEVLLVYTFLSLVMVIPQAPAAGGLEPVQFLWIALKSFVIFIAWIAGFKAIKQLPISMYGILDLSRVIFATLLGIFVLGESVTVNKLIGLILVSAGLLFLKFNPFAKQSGVIRKTAEVSDSVRPANTAFFVFLAFLSCILNAVSGLLDKILMRTMTSSQLQFWYTLFLVIFYAIYALATRTRISRGLWKNIWIWLLAAGLIVMDKALFVANGMPESQVTVMTLIKQSSVIVAILAGKFVFKEKNIVHKAICAAIVVAGIIVGVC